MFAHFKPGPHTHNQRGWIITSSPTTTNITASPPKEWVTRTTTPPTTAATHKTLSLAPIEIVITWGAYWTETLSTALLSSPKPKPSTNRPLIEPTLQSYTIPQKTPHMRTGTQGIARTPLLSTPTSTKSMIWMKGKVSTSKSPSTKPTPSPEEILWTTIRLQDKNINTKEKKSTGMLSIRDIMNLLANTPKILRLLLDMSTCSIIPHLIRNRITCLLKVEGITSQRLPSIKMPNLSKILKTLFQNTEKILSMSTKEKQITTTSLLMNMMDKKA